MKAKELNSYTLEQLVDLEKTLQYDLLRCVSGHAAGSGDAKNRVGIRKALARVMTQLGREGSRRGS